VAAYVGERGAGERFRDYTRRKSDEELISIGSGRPLADGVAEMKTRRPHLREREEAGEA